MQWELIFVEELDLSHQKDDLRYRIIQLRASLKSARSELSEAEEELKEQQAEVQSLERRLRFRLGRLVDELAALEDEIGEYQSEISRRRSPEGFGGGYLPVEEQFQRTWQSPETDDEDTYRDPYGDAEPIKELDKKQFKKLFRRLARRYHPDLAASEQEKETRNKQMVALNEAYAAESIVELMVLDDENELANHGFSEVGKDGSALVKTLELELARIQRRTLLIKNEIENLHNSPIVQLSLEISLAKRNGRDLLAEMEFDLKRTISRRRAERELLRSQLDQLNGDD